jgi:hypothetical protein
MDSQNHKPSPAAFTWWKAKLLEELSLPYRRPRKDTCKKDGFIEVQVSGGRPASAYELLLTNTVTSMKR